METTNYLSEHSMAPFRDEREASPWRPMTEGGVGGRRGGRGKTGSSSLPQIKGPDLGIR